jgi:ABC-type multidrug transport system ATPase subunit
VEAVANRIAVIASGRLLEHATPEALLRSAEGKCWEWTVASEDFPTVKREHQVSATMRREDGVRVRVVAESRPVSEAAVAPPTLEDAYLLRLAVHRAAAAS